jgi:phosphoribosylamine--glycine ligase
MKDRVAVIGSGGREHVQIKSLLKSPHVSGAIAIPGNDFMRLGNTKPVETFPGVKIDDVRQIVRICKDKKIKYVEVGNERAVKAGVVDFLTEAGISTLGPTAAAGIIEYDKGFSRWFGRKHFLPQPRHKWFVSVESGIAFIESQPEEHRFVKYAGLCDGKGAFGVKTRAEAIDAIKEMRKLNKGDGEAFLIEEWLKNDDGTPGQEFSSFCLSDGEALKHIGDAQDYKRVNDGDDGKNTGGMGCRNNPAVVNAKTMLQIDEILKRTIFGMGMENRRYKGILYLGGIVVMRDGVPTIKVIEFNARPGDPEWQVIAPGIKSDMFILGRSAIQGHLWGTEVERDGRSRVSVAGVAKGYPDDYSAVIGKQIFGLEEASALPGIEIFGAGISVIEGRHYVNGGRIFHVMGEGSNPKEAKERAYDALLRISVEGDNLHYRKDIALRD